MSLEGIVIISMIVLTSISFFIVYSTYIKAYKLKFPFDETIDKTGLPIVSFRQGNKLFYFLIDSGADASSLNYSSLSKLEYIKLNGDGEVYGIDGNKIQTFFVGVKFFAKKHSFIEAFQVLDIPGLNNLSKEANIEIIGILGNTFLKKYRFIIDYKTLKAYTNGKENKSTNA